MTIEMIKAALKQTLKPSRYDHTLGVAQTASELAKQYGCDASDVLYAALLHDCAKCMDEEEQIRICATHNVILSDAELGNPALIHAKAGVVVAREQYDITDPAILHAICYHTTGCTDMSLLDKIIFIADYIEPGRNRAPRLEQLRQEAFQDIDLALVHILEDTIAFLKASEKPIDTTTINTYEYYMQKEDL